jgi:hypothetical protein
MFGYSYGKRQGIRLANGNKLRVSTRVLEQGPTFGATNWFSRRGLVCVKNFSRTLI